MEDGVADFMHEDALPFLPVDQIDSIGIGMEDTPILYRLAFLRLMPFDGDGMTADDNRLRL